MEATKILDCGATHRVAMEEAIAAGMSVPLAYDTRATVDTATAAFHLGRQPQTLRGWACKEDGPLRPIRVHGRLAWPTDEIRRLLGVSK